MTQKKHIYRLVAFLLMLGLVGVHQPSDAQSTHSSPSQEQQTQPSYYQSGPEESSSQPGRLPSWAEPRRRSRSSAPGSNRQALEGQNGQFRTDNRDNIKPGVPVDGGLFWLALAGGGFAVVRLYFSGEDAS